MRFAARILILGLFAICLGFAASLAYLRPAFAQTVNPPQNLHNYTQNVMIEVISSMTCLIAGVDPITPSQKCLGVENGKIGPVDTKGGAIGAMGDLISMTFAIPVHTGEYVKYLAGNFGIAKPALAANDGFSQLSPLIEIWKAFRNITYLLFVVIFVIIGFAIMLRIHIDPRTVMTIENQIPKLVIALILVTFSFAIAGFLVDLMYIFIYLIIGVLSSIPNVPKPSSEFTNVWGHNPIETINSLQLSGGTSGITGIANAAKSSIQIILQNLFSGLFSIPVIGGVFNGLVGLLAFLIIAIAILFALFRLWFSLIMAYVYILLGVVFVPFWILLGLVPGSSLSFTAWLRGIASELLAFPATIAMFMLGGIFVSGFSGKSGIFVPPLIGNPGESAFSSLIGLGIILMTPNVVNLMKAALKAPKFDIPSVGQAVGAGQAVVGGAIAQTAGSIFVATQGTLKPDEKGLGAIFRRSLR